MKCTLKLNDDFTDWFEKYKAVSHTTLLQSPIYTTVVTKHAQQCNRFYDIYIDTNQCIGIFSAREVSLLYGAVHGIILDRGPLWLNDYATINHQNAFIEAFAQKFPRRFGRRRRFIPEMSNTPELRQYLATHGFKHKSQSVYETYLLDLTLDQEVLRQNLKKNWRSALKKAEQKSPDCRWHSTPEVYVWLRNVYESDKKSKGYDGLSVLLLDKLATAFMKSGDLIIGTIDLHNTRIAGILLFCHGQSATYQIGWTSPLGRTQNAHNLLLWKSLGILKKRGIKTLDLGGANEQTAKHIKTFKAGMGGQHIVLPGLYT